MKTFRLTLLLISIVGIFSSCGKKSDPIDTTGDIYSFDLGKAVFYGDIYNNGSNVFDVYLMDNGLSIDNDGYITGSGYYLYLDLNTPTSTNDIPLGTYSATNDGSNYSFFQGSFYSYTGTMGRPYDFNHPKGSYLAKVVDGEAIEFYLINSGNITISNSNIEGNLYSTDGVNINFEYSGNINSAIIDDVSPMPENLTKGELWYWGNIEDNGLNIFTIRLGDDNTDLDELSGGSDMMTIEVYTPTSVTTILPDGTYPVQVNSPAAQTTIDGYTASDGTNYGTWYYAPAANYAITQGSLTVQHLSGDTYNLSFAFMDNNNISISRSNFNVTLGYYSISSNSIKQQMRNSSKIKRTYNKRINTKVRIKRNNM